MRKLFVVASIFAVLLISMPTCAEININTSGLSEEQKAQLVLQTEQMKKQAQADHPQNIVDKIAQVATTEKASELISLGKNLGLAIAAVAKELGVATDEFLQSNTGKITVVLIVWKVAGRDIVNIVGGSVGWVVLVSIILWSFRYFHMTKAVKSKDSTIQYLPRYEFRSSDARAVSACAHVVAFVLTTLLCMLIIF